MDEFLANPKLFKEIKDLHEHHKDIDDKILARAVDVLYLQYLEKQVDTVLLKKMTAKSNAIEKAFNEYRAKVDGKEMTDNEVRAVLQGVERFRPSSRLSGSAARASAPPSKKT